MNYQKILNDRDGVKIPVSEFYEMVDATGIARVDQHSNEPSLKFLGVKIGGKVLCVPEWFFADVNEFFDNIRLTRMVPQDSLLPDFKEFDNVNILSVFTGYQRYMRDIRRVDNKVTWAGFVEGYRQALLDYKCKCPHCETGLKMEEQGNEL